MINENDNGSGDNKNNNKILLVFLANDYNNIVECVVGNVLQQAVDGGGHEKRTRDGDCGKTTESLITTTQ